ncbi:hypothetical protein L6164_002740 [Bauhinia variegata]|uniref:Uncharacterized protein n=1 Tax=Bauhinia variegata TaxID=167791 RepID=A0ACB9PYK8_BAUVA|nr:hypothetical protein L6164_002740 [Bauhinia variegata]
MRNLTEIWHKVGNDVGSDSYCNLESVVIEKCRKLVTVFPPHMAGMLKSIDSLMVDGSDSVETSIKGRCKEADLLSCCINNCHLDSLKELTLNRLKNSDFLFRLLPRTPNLEKLYLWNCDFQKLLPPRRLAALEKIGTVVQLKDLSLMGMNFLRDMGFEQDPTLFQQLQRLTIDYCRGLTNLALGSICFNHLTYLEVRGCHGLINLMESSTAKSLSQLTTLEVSNRKMTEEIVAEKGSGDERENEIPFHGLTTLKLHSLKNLSSFCRSKYCLFVFPLLECLVVCKCPKMKIFSQGAVVKAPSYEKCIFVKPPKLRKVYFAIGKEEGKSYWSDDLSNTIHKVSTDVTGLEYIDVLNLRDHLQLPQLEEFWHGNVPLPENCFANLKSLVVENCEFLSIGIPYHVHPCLKNLEELEVESCISMEKIFDISNIKTGGVPFRLRRLTLRNLPNLKNVW